MPKHQFSERLISETKEALRDFGTYSFDDKGPHDVMNIPLLMRGYKELSQSDKVQVAKDLKRHQRPSIALDAILADMYQKENPDLSTEEMKEIVLAGHEILREDLDIDFSS